MSKSVCARESEEKGKVQESAQRIGLGLKKKKKNVKCAGNEAEAAVELSLPPRLAVAV